MTTHKSDDAKKKEDLSAIEVLIDSLYNEQVVINNTTFTIKKLPPEDAFDVLEDIRESIGGRMMTTLAAKQVLSEGSIGEMINQVVKIFLSVLVAMPKNDAKKVRSALFEQVSFKNRLNRAEMRLKGNENLAYADLEPIHIHELWLRSMAINFQGSWSVMSSLFELNDQNSPPRPTET